MLIFIALFYVYFLYLFTRFGGQNILKAFGGPWPHAPWIRLWEDGKRCGTVGQTSRGERETNQVRI